MTTRNYTNTSIPVTLSTGVNAAATTFIVPSTAGYPPAPFTIGIERGTSNEEVCLVTGLTSTQFTVVRAYNGTTALPHLAGVAIEHCAIALDYSEPNFHINDQTHDQHSQYLRRDTLTTKGDIYVRTASGIVRVGVGTDGQVLTADAASTGGVKWSTLSFLPAGVMWLYGGAAAPTGWLFCDGSTLNRTTYAALFAAIGTGWATGGEAGTDFRLPDFRGRVPVGAGQGGGLVNRVLAARGGEENHQLTVAEMPAHNHTQVAHSHTLGLAIEWSASVFSGLRYMDNINNTFQPAYASLEQPVINNTGGNGTHNNMQPFAVCNVIIKT